MAKLIKKAFYKINNIVSSFGFNMIGLFFALRSIPWFLISYFSFKRKNLFAISKIREISIYPVFSDRFENAGDIKSHYFWQDLIVAQKIFSANPRIHCDIGSRIDGFVAHVAAFRKIFVFDIRPMQSNIKNIQFVELDLMKELREEYIEFADSVSCLHALEHFGLGRYNDNINPDGFIVGLAQISKIVKPGGIFYLSVPVGRERIEFNAHRVFNPKTIIELLNDNFEILRSIIIDEKCDIVEYDVPELFLSNVGTLEYGCGIFIAKKFNKLH